MYRLTILSVFVCLAPAAAAAQDPVTSNPTVYRVLVDNPSVRVLRVSVPPGAKYHDARAPGQHRRRA